MNVYDFVVTDNKKQEVSLKEYAGKVLLIVNTATGCGLTPQYEALEATYKKYKEKGFEILDFPCNQFMNQAKGSDEEIHSFCTVKYATTFPRFKKIEVNGENASPLFKHLKDSASHKTEGGGLKGLMIRLTSKINGESRDENDIKWNFTKFLIDREGNVVERFEPTVTPEEIEPSIEKIL